MQAILFALISYTGFGIGGVLEALISRRMNPLSTLFWLLLGSVILSTFYIPFARPSFGQIPIPVLLFTIGLSFITVFGGTIFYYEAFRRENPALVQTIAGSFPMVSTLLSLLFLGEKVSTNQAVAILVIFIGLILVLFEISRIQNRGFQAGKGLLLALLPMIFWGIYWAFIKIPVREIGWFWPEYISFAALIFVPILAKMRNQHIEKVNNRSLWLLLFAIILVRVAEFGYNFAIGKGLVAVVAPIAGSNPTLFVLLSFFIFKEPVSRQPLVGIFVTLTGIVLLSIFSV